MWTAFQPIADASFPYPRPIWLYVGRVAVEKNIEAFLNLDLPGTKVIVGDGPARASLELRYPEAKFVGQKFGDDLVHAYAASDVFVFPSRTDTFGLVMLEALACGTPVAAYPVQGPLDVVGGSGVAALDEDLATACRKALYPRQECLPRLCAEPLMDGLHPAIPVQSRDRATRGGIIGRLAGPFHPPGIASRFGARIPSGPLMSLPSADLRDFRLAPREWLFFAVVIAFWAGFVVWMGKDTSWDFRNYHWYIPYAWLNGRMGIDIAVAHQASYYNPFLDIPFYLLATHTPSWFSLAVLGAVQGANVVPLYIIARQSLRLDDFHLGAAAAGAAGTDRRPRPQPLRHALLRQCA